MEGAMRNRDMPAYQGEIMTDPGGERRSPLFESAPGLTGLTKFEFAAIAMTQGLVGGDLKKERGLLAEEGVLQAGALFDEIEKVASCGERDQLLEAAEAVIESITPTMEGSVDGDYLGGAVYHSDLVIAQLRNAIAQCRGDGV